MTNLWEQKRDDIIVDEQFIAWAGKRIAEQMRKGREKGWRGWHDPKQCPVERLGLFAAEAVKRGDLTSAATYKLMIAWRNEHDKKGDGK